MLPSAMCMLLDIALHGHICVQVYICPTWTYMCTGVHMPYMYRCTYALHGQVYICPTWTGVHMPYMDRCTYALHGHLPYMDIYALHGHIPYMDIYTLHGQV